MYTQEQLNTMTPAQLQTIILQSQAGAATQQETAAPNQNVIDNSIAQDAADQTRELTPAQNSHVDGTSGQNGGVAVMQIDRSHLIMAVVFLVIGLTVGLGVGHILGEKDRQALAVEKNKPPEVKETVRTVTDTKLQYVPGQTIYLSAPASQQPTTPVSKDTPGAVAEKLDGKFEIGKPDFIYMVNGKVGKFTKTDDEKYVFDKNMLDLKQSSTVTIQAEIPIIDLTRNNVLTGGVMIHDGKTEPAASYTGRLGKVGAWQVAGSQGSQYVGVGFKF